MSTISDAPKRFPRLYKGVPAAALASLLRSNPLFKVKLPSDRMSVVFSYEFSVPDQIPPQFLELYEVLFSGGRKHWKSALSVAKKKAEERKNRALGRVHNFHQGILIDSFETWLFESWGLGPDYRVQRKEQLEKFRRGSGYQAGCQNSIRGCH